MSNQESSRTSEDESVTRDSIISYSDLGDSSAIDTSVTPNNNEAKLRNAPSSKLGGGPSPFYRRKRFWAMCVAINVVLTAIFLPLLYLVIIPAAARSAINNSKLNFQSINITNETNDSFIVDISGETTKTGPFSAKVDFNGPVTILYNNKELGSAEMGNFGVSKGRGDVASRGHKFTINNKPQFTDFAATTLTTESFKWTVLGSVNVQTFGTKIKNIKFSKDVNILGSNGYNVNLVDLKISQTPDKKALSLEIKSTLYNPSPIGIELGDVYLQIFYNGTIIANATAKGVFLSSKENNLTMTAISGIPTTTADIFNYLKVIEGYLTNTPVTTVGKIISIESPNGKIDWLNAAAQKVNLTSTIGQVKAPQLINGVDFGEMNIKFTPDAPFSPTISAKNANAKLTSPFNIDFEILSVSQKITLFSKGKPIARVESPESNVTSTGTGITLDIPETQMIVDKDLEDSFKDFLVSLTTGKEVDVDVVGTSDARVTTIIGENLPIQGLPFKVSTTLQGFNQFNGDGGPPAVSNVTILEGTSDQLVIGAIVILTNPSGYSTSIGQVSFDLFYREQKIGTVVIPDLNVVPGPNPLTVIITLQDPENNAGKELITAFLTNQSITLDIRGTDNSTNIASLIPAFKAIDISTTLPSLEQQLVSSSKLVVDNQTTKGVVGIENKFMAPLSIYTMKSSFSFNGNVLGSYEEDISNNPIFIPGNTVQNLEIPVTMNPDPVVSFTMLRTLALQNNLDVSVLDSLIVLSKVNVPGVDPNVQPTPEAIKSFDLAKFVTTALAKIPVTVNLDSRVAIGYYFMSITYQQNMTVETDSSIVSLIPQFAQPIMSQIIGQSQMSFDSMYAFNIDVSSFDIFITGQVLNTGPLPAQVNFPNGIEVSSNNIVLGKVVNIPTITVDPIDGAKLNGTSGFEIADITVFTSFAEAMFTVDTITGSASGDAFITSFGAQIGPIPINQSVSMAGFAGLQQQQQEKLIGFTFPTPENPEFSAKVALGNPSAAGIELGKIVLNLFLENEQVSTVTGDNVAIFPKGESTLELHGLLDFTNPKIISSLLAKTPMVAQGVSITPPKATGEVVWLTEPFKKFVFTVPLQLPAAPQQ